MDTTKDPAPTINLAPTIDPAPTIALDTPPVVSANPHMPNVPGYDVIALVGRGGMGRVYRAKHLALERIVAVKLLSHEPDELHLARFREEVRAVAKLQHPNIAQLFETGLADGQPFFTQEFLDGGSLAQSFARKPQDPMAAARIVETITRAIQHSHEHSILHRDLKPANILLASDGTPKVTDFGLAKTFTTIGEAGETAVEGAGLTHTGEILGTPAYMPPEQASGILSLLGPPADVYGLGAILYEALTGRPPFLAPDALRTVMMVREMEPISPRTLQPDVPRDLETICLKCLAKEPHKRYASAGELADDLRRFQNREPIRARPVGFWERTTKWARRKPWQAAAAGLGLLLGVGLAVGLVFFAQKNREIRDAYDQLASANTELETTNNTLSAALKREEKANTDLTAAKNLAEAENHRAEQTLGLALNALTRYYFTFSDRLKEIPQAEKLRLDVLRQARGTFDDLSRFQPDNTRLQQFRMEGYDRLGNLETQMGNLIAAEGDHSKARDIAAKLATRFPDEPSYKSDRILMIAKIASIHIRRGDPKAADILLDLVLPEMNALVATHPENPSVLDMELAVRPQLLNREVRLGHWNDVETRLREMCDFYRRLAKTDKDNPAKVLAVIDADRQLAVFLTDLEKFDEASATLNEAARGIAALKEPLSVNARKLRANLAASEGTYFQRRKVYYLAFVVYAAALNDYEMLAKDFPDSPFYAYQQADTLRYLTIVTSAIGDPWVALRYLERAQKILAGLTNDYPDNATYRSTYEDVSRLLKLSRRSRRGLLPMRV